MAQSQRRTKQSRTQRSPSRQLVITKRDVEVFILAGLCRYLSTSQIARSLFPSEDRARRRLRQLFNDEYISITLVHSQQPNLVSLAARGKAVVSKRYPALGRKLRITRAIKLAGVEHHLAVIDARLYAAALGELRQAQLLRWSNSGGDLHSELGLSRFQLQPDGLAEFAAAQGAVAVAVEVDLGTEPLSVLASKLERYEAVAWDGAVDSLWLVAKGQAGRLRSLEQQLLRHGLEAWGRVIEHQHVNVRPVQELPTAGGKTDGLSYSPNTGKTL